MKQLPDVQAAYFAAFSVAPPEPFGVDDERIAAVLAQAVIDASGTIDSPNPLGAAGIPALGERSAHERIRYGMPDDVKAERSRYAGKRVVVSARGDIFTVPVKDGSVRNLTATAGVREKDALWSPDGKRVAYISDAGLQHKLVLCDQAGLEKPQTMELGKSGYFTLLAWSPGARFRSARAGSSAGWRV